MKRLFSLILFLMFSVVVAHAQNPAIPLTQPVQAQTAYYGLTAISSTGTGNAQTTLTIPAPVQSGYYNYICYLSLDVSVDATATVSTNMVTTSTNFNSFALKFSQAGTANTSYDWSEHWGTPAGGCVKSVSPTTATTFVSPGATAHLQFTWYATYYQAP